tara:strand:- start:16054 stop:16287 length:234 start_codon:yes stop_codon:yes gene_type:complete
MGFGLDQDIMYEDISGNEENFAYWEGRDGKSYKVSSMKESHIRNCINMIITKRFDRQWLEYCGDDWLEVFENELGQR